MYNALLPSLRPVSAFTYDEADRLFTQTLQEIFEYEDVDDTSVRIERELLHDADLLPLGLVYSFTYNGTDGFAILIEQSGILSVNEFATDGTSPYAGIEGQYIYLDTFSYFYQSGEIVFEALSGLPVDAELWAALRETAYQGSDQFIYTSETITYTHRTESPYNIQFSIPSYTYGLSNGCGSVAGTNIIAYLDRWHTNLIPNYDPGAWQLGVSGGGTRQDRYLHCANGLRPSNVMYLPITANIDELLSVKVS